MTVKISDEAYKQLVKLDKNIKKRILRYLEQLEDMENPRAAGKALVGELKGLWRYRVGNYRIICIIKDHNLEIKAIKIGHRKNIYN